MFGFMLIRKEGKQHRMKRLSMAALVLLCICIVMVGCSSKTGATAAQQVATVKRGNLAVNITTSGNLAASVFANLNFGSSGTVDTVLVQIGDMVEKDQVLARLDTSDLESAYASAQISVKQARVNLENAKVPSTSGAGTSAPDPLNIELKELSLKNAITNEAAAAKKLEKATIRAPFAGKITEVNVDPEDTVSATTIAVRMINPEKFYTDVSVSEMDIYDLKVGTKATVRIVARSTYNLPAKVSLITETPTISSNVVTYKVKVELDPIEQQTTRGGSRMPASASQPASLQDMQLREGLTVTVYISISEKNDILLVPTRAIVSRVGRSYVQVLTPSGATEERAITVGISDGENTEVVSGLTEGERVAIAGTSGTTSTSTIPQQRQQTIPVPGVGSIPSGGGFTGGGGRQ